MILIKKILNKLFTSMLLLVTAFACAFAIPARKTLASAETNPDGIPDEVLIEFTEYVISDIQFTENGEPLCFMLDRQLFTEFSTVFDIDETTTLSDINASPVIQTMALDFADKLEIEYELDEEGLIDAQAIFSQINMVIIIHVQNRTYREVIGGGTLADISNYNNLRDLGSLITETTSIYSMQMFAAVSAFYNFLVSVQRNHEGPMYNYALDLNNAGHIGTLNVNIYQH